MKITSVDIYKTDIDLIEPFRIANLEVTCSQEVFIKINTDEGIHGIGESCPSRVLTGETQLTNYAIAPDIARLIIGKDPLNIENRIKEINTFLFRNNSLRSGFDMALYDLLGKVLNKPLYNVFGGGKRTVWTDETVSIDKPDTMAEKAKVHKSKGFKAIKVKLGKNGLEDIERVVKIRRAIGDELPIRIDANQGWSYQTAIYVLRSIENLGIEYCEQPISRYDLDGLKRLRQITTIPLMADEALLDDIDAFNLAKMGCCDYFNIKLSKSGGLHTALKINSIAEGAGIKCMMGCRLETRLGLTAAAHIVSARQNIIFADLDGSMHLKEDPITGGASFLNGEINLTDAPGHGADIHPEFLSKCESLTIN